MSKPAFSGQQQRPVHAKFCKILTSIAQRHQVWRIFADFCELTALSLSNAVEKDDAREQRWAKVIQPYERNERETFCRLLACVVEGLEADGAGVPTCDFLGEVFQELELASHWHGQYFTPWDVARMMAEMMAPQADDAIISHHGFINVSEPASGSGVMVLALAAAMRANGLNPQRQMLVHAVDVDATAAYMAFIQFSLWHIPATVVLGNCLTLEERQVLYTPAYFLGHWRLKVIQRHALERIQELTESSQSARPASDDGLPVSAPDVQEIAGEREDESAPITAPPRPQLSLF